MRMIKLKIEYVGKGNLVLVNKKFDVKTLAEELVPFSESFKNITISRDTNRALHLLLNGIGAGERIVPVSGYRSFEEQAEIYNTSLNENGSEYTKKYVAIPGASEHQTGLAIDLALNEGEIDFICPRFPRFGICEEFRKTAAIYGFIERYKEEKREVTGISGEEWHFRYVGFPHSKIIEESGFCLEEYIEYLKAFVYPDKPLKSLGYAVYYIPCGGDGAEIAAEGSFTVSGNNADGFILTVKESGI